MNFILKLPSLEDITLINIAVSLWNQHDIRALVKKFFSNSPGLRASDSVMRGKCREIENRVLENMLQLTMPTCFKEKISSYIQTIGLQIFIWMRYHLSYCQIDLDLPNEFSWTPHATIDKTKTAEVLISDDSIDVATRFKLACIYCLEDDIRKLWNQVPDCLKEHFYYVEDPYVVLQMELVEFWALYINGENDCIRRIARRRLNRVCSPFQYAFESAAYSGSKVATEYFLQKPSQRKALRVALNVSKVPHEFKPSINDDSPKEYNSEVLCFLLSKLNEEELVQLFRQRPLQVLYCCLDWPWQSFFLEMASRVWNFLHRRNHHFVLTIILSKIRSGYKDYNYKKLFWDLWEQMSDSDKNYIINDDMSIVSLLDMLLQVEDKESIKLVLKDATRIEINKLIFSNHGRSLCKKMIVGDKFDLLKFFVQLLISSKDEMVKFKQEFEESLEIREKQVFIDKYEEFSRILDDFVLQYDKEKV